jgi:hypothetical protein
MGRYKFLMRFYAPRDDIYLFGFSRGAYTARFLAEMLDHVGLVSQGNEEMVSFAWKTFSNWQKRRDGDGWGKKKKEMYEYVSPTPLASVAYLVRDGETSVWELNGRRRIQVHEGFPRNLFKTREEGAVLGIIRHR